MRVFAFTVILLALGVAFVMPDEGLEASGEAETVMVEPQAAPPAPTPAANVYGAVSFERGPGGHFWTDAEVEYGHVRFLVDTGATGVVLTEEDARRVGIRLDPSSYRVVGRQVSGDVRGQFVTLRWISVGGRRVDNVEGIVVEGAHLSLLGQSFLSRAGRIEMQGDRMMLH
ncbi:retropepsin-like aspartic protease family protein [Sphingomicrobium aestuariivivum]|uniref:retropepsin-like aspartic protease family protein n=1 Tax=Sphingomicrobium aestuariivivum TaxID=1582356 RepID=UPI001FD6D45B|nr:TIGR02281 family clan AA aspartic protease [Sphingomicrobium aestuariivivum]MCJ8191254.1 TIGR02281 family clan AA aspartic protease [Sphingomicrobium aestuariivivum]